MVLVAISFMGESRIYNLKAVGMSPKVASSQRWISIRHQGSRIGNNTGCSSAWLECLVWDQEAEGSNPFTPTNRDPFFYVLRALFFWGGGFASASAGLSLAGWFILCLVVGS